MLETKICMNCEACLPLKKFDKYRNTCRSCRNKYKSVHAKEHPEKWRAYAKKNREKIRNYQREWRHERGISRPMSEAKDSASYLGVFVAERVLSKFFENITRMPNNNPYYDFVCGKGFRIDVKCGCLCKSGHGLLKWRFNINKNTIADYFLLLAFDNRTSLEPQHVWLIPGSVVNKLLVVSITNDVIPLKRRAQYERPLDKVIACCSEMRVKT